MLLGLCSGCAPDGRAEVAGEIILDGKPLNGGLITFRPTAGTSGPEFSAHVLGGKFRVVIRVLPGQYAVDIRSWQKTGRMAKNPYGGVIDEIVNVIPRSYWGSQTKLSANVVAGENQLSFQVSK